MKKILLIIFTLSIVSETYAQLVESRTMLTSYDIVQPKAKKERSKKKEWKFRLGLSASTLTGEDLDSDSKLGNHTGYHMGFEYRRFGRKGLFYGMEFNFASRGYTIDDVTITKEDGEYYRYGYWVPNYTTYTGEAKQTSHVFEWVPVNFGYRYDINKDVAVSTRVGLYINAIMKATYTVDDYEQDYFDVQDATRANVGLKWGIGAQWKKLAVDFEIQKSFIDHMEDFAASERAINFTVGYIF